MRLIDADAFEELLNNELLPLLIKKYGEEEALKGLHFSFRDVICNIQSQQTIDPCEIAKMILHNAIDNTVFANPDMAHELHIAIEEADNEQTNRR